MLPDQIDALVRAAQGPVAFDADGTLWAGDVGDELVRAVGRFDEYERRVARDPLDGYAWAVEILEGHPVEQLEELSRRLFAKQRIFDFVPGLLGRLGDVYIVSASPLWAVLPGADALGVDRSRVIAVDAEVRGGRIGRVRTPIPCGAGKVHHLQARGLRPALAFGNGELDEPMLSYARHAVVVAPREGPDNRLVAAAGRNGWQVLRA